LSLTGHRNCRAIIDERFLSHLQIKHKSNRKQTDFIHEYLLGHCRNAQEKIREQSINDRRRKAAKKLLTDKYIGRIEITGAKLKNEFGDSIYWLTPSGSEYLSLTSNIHPNWMRTYPKKYSNLSFIRHELMVSLVYYSIDRHQRRQNYQLIDIKFNPSPGISGKRVKGAYYADLSATIKMNGISRKILIEIDNGTQPAAKTRQRAAIKDPLLFVCRDDDTAFQRLAEASTSIRGVKLFTSIGRMENGGIFEAGYISFAKQSFCSCSRLVEVPLGENDVGIRDCHGCPCIYSLFYVVPEPSKDQGRPQPPHPRPPKMPIPISRPTSPTAASQQSRQAIQHPSITTRSNMVLFLQWTVEAGYKSVVFLIGSLSRIVSSFFSVAGNLIWKTLTSKYTWVLISSALVIRIFSDAISVLHEVISPLLPLIK